MRSDCKLRWSDARVRNADGSDGGVNAKIVLLVGGDARTVRFIQRPVDLFRDVGR